jgi:signal transduction histidine kinase
MLFEGLTESMDRMHSIIEEVLISSRIMTSQIELNLAEIQLGSIVQRVITGFTVALRERELTLHWDETEYPETMIADSDLIRVTISNLISNAIKYTPNGGEIFVSAQHSLNLLRVSVRDTGVGVDPAMQIRIFERLHIGADVALHTTSKTAFGGGGLGLGLAICKGIVEAHGGKIQVDSPGYDRQRLPGSEFTMYLPLQPTATSKPPKMKRFGARSVG